MSITFRKAERGNIKPIIGLYGLSGNGKTYSALMLARGMAGNHGKIAMLDTESGRGEMYADDIEGGYYYFGMKQPFTAQSYINAIDAAEEAKIDIMVIDSMSHEWEGSGGILEQVAIAQDKASKAGKKTEGLHFWKKPKESHNKLILRIMQSTIPVICCFRAQCKTHYITIKGKKEKEVVKDDFTTPIQDEKIIYEMTAHMEIGKDHKLKITKCPKGLDKCLKNGDIITVKTGECIAEWCKGDTGSSAIPLSSKDDLVAHINDIETMDKLKQYWMQQQPSINALSDDNKKEVTQAKEDKKNLLTYPPEESDF